MLKKDIMANELISYFTNFDDVKRLAEVMCLPHIHHFETKPKPRGSIFSSTSEDLNSKKGIFPFLYCFNCESRVLIFREFKFLEDRHYLETIIKLI